MHSGVLFMQQTSADNSLWYNINGVIFMNAKEATELYYSRWLGSKENLFAKQCTPLMLLYMSVNWIC